MNDDRVVVALKNGMHANTRKYALGEIKILLEDLLERAGMKGAFRVTLGARKRGRKHMNRVRVLGESGSAVRLKVKPGDNNTCCEVYVIVPHDFNGRAFDFLELLRAAAPHLD